MLTQDQLNFLNKISSEHENKFTWKDNEETGRVDISGSINLSDMELTEFAGILFGKIDGDFNCSINRISDIDGFPTHVTGSFDCSINEITSLEKMPRIIEGSFSFGNNHVSSLENGPEKVGKGYKCSSNPIKTLKGCPDIIKGTFACGSCNLTSMKFGPTWVDGSYICGNNRLNSLRGLPEYIGGTLHFPHNELINISDIVRPRGNTIFYKQQGPTKKPNRNAMSIESLDLIIPKFIDYGDLGTAVAAVYKKLTPADQTIFRSELPKEWESIANLSSMGLL